LSARIGSTAVATAGTDAHRRRAADVMPAATAQPASCRCRRRRATAALPALVLTLMTPRCRRAA